MDLLGNHCHRRGAWVAHPEEENVSCGTCMFPRPDNTHCNHAHSITLIDSGRRLPACSPVRLTSRGHPQSSSLDMSQHSYRAPLQTLPPTSPASPPLTLQTLGHLPLSRFVSLEPSPAYHILLHVPATCTRSRLLLTHHPTRSLATQRWCTRQRAIQPRALESSARAEEQAQCPTHTPRSSAAACCNGGRGEGPLETVAGGRDVEGTKEAGVLRSTHSTPTPADPPGTMGTVKGLQVTRQAQVHHE
jgi:hypothetical protein